MDNQTTLKTKNFNIATILNNSQSLDSFSNITINNTIKISKSANQTNNTSDNSNANIFLKDVNSNGTGGFYPLYVSSITGQPELYYNSNVIIHNSNLLSELEEILNYYPLETSNLIVKGGYINFWNGSNTNSNIGSNGVGIRYSSNNTVQFRNWNTDWIDLSDITTHDQFSELNDVDVHTVPLLDNQYITYDSATLKYVNSNLAIINDTTPTLGGNLKVGTYYIKFQTNPTELIYDNGVDVHNTLIQFQDNTTVSGNVNYLQIDNADLGNDPIIHSEGTSTDIGLSIVAKGTGNINLNASLGSIYTNSDSLVIDGYIQNSIYRSSSKSGGYTPSTFWNIPLTNDIFLFDFVNSNTSGTYWANVSVGIEGQKINFIFNNQGSNSISVMANFGFNGLLVGTGYSNTLVFTTSGQSCSLVYLGGGIDAWQVLNTGAGVI